MNSSTQTPELNKNNPAHPEQKALPDAEKNLETMLRKEGLQLTEQEYKELGQIVPALFHEASPQFENYLIQYGPKLETLIQESNNLKKEGKNAESLLKITEFLEEEVNRLGQTADSKTKEQILGYLGVVLDVAKNKEEMDAQLKKQLVSNGLDIVPVVGSGKMLTEAAVGKTLDGRDLHGGKRALHAVEGVAFLAVDAVAVAGLATGGVVTAAAEGAKVARVTGKTAKAGIDIGKTVSRFAALVRATTPFTNASRTIFKIGQFMKKHPKLVGAISRVAENRQRQRKEEKIEQIKSQASDLKKAPMAVQKELDKQAVVQSGKREIAKIQQEIKAPPVKNRPAQRGK